MTRQRGISAVMVAVALVLVLLAAGFSWSNESAIARWLEDVTGETAPAQQLNGLLWHVAQRDPRTDDFAVVPGAGVYPYGANTFFEQEVEEWKLRRSMEMLNAAGVRWVRQQMPWDRIEFPSKGRYDSPFGGSTWDSYDRFIRLANEYDLEIVARLDLPPEWARRAPFEWEERTLPQAAPRDLEDYGDFVEAFVSRYRGQIRYYQIWNEPNLFSDWGEAIDAGKYTQMLRIASTRARAANPDVVIISAAIAATLGTPDGFNQDDLSYIQQLYDAGAARYFDVLATQGHGLWTGPGSPRASPAHTTFARVELIRELMVKNGDAAKPIWVSELGWDALPLDFPKPPSHGRVTDEQQARYTVDAYRRAEREWPWLGVLFYWHFRRVHEENRAEVDFYYRMADPDFRTQPVYDAFAAMTAEPATAGIGFHQGDHWALVYEGNWRLQPSAAASGGQVRVAESAGNRVSLRFEGTAVALAQVAQASGGAADWTLVDASDRMVASGTVGFRTVLPSPRVIGLADRLRPGIYTLSLTVTEPSAELDGFIVKNEPWTWLQVPIAIVLVLGSAGVVALLILRGRRRPV